MCLAMTQYAHHVRQQTAEQRLAAVATLRQDAQCIQHAVNVEWRRLDQNSTKSAAARQSSVVLERNPGVSMITRPPPWARRRAVLEASSVASSSNATPPRARSRAASRMMERCGSASMRVGRRPLRCQCTARQLLASVLLPPLDPHRSHCDNHAHLHGLPPRPRAVIRPLRNCNGFGKNCLSGCFRSPSYAR